MVPGSTTRLDSTTLDRLGPRVAVPGYDRTHVTAGIVHIGVGAFHRSHEAMYVDRLLAAGETGWGICGVGLLVGDRVIADVLATQDNLYTLVSVGPDGSRSARVIGSVVDYLYAPDDPGAVLDRLASPATRIVSLTITEGGYSISDATGAFEPHDPDTVTDLTSDRVPRSALGLVVAALAVRRDHGTAPFTVMSCDNIQGNGQVTRTAVVAFAAHKDPGLAAWIADEVAFPSSMVDRITPPTDDETRARVAADFGVDDGSPVRCEEFEQWVLEDRFSLGRPPWDQVGVQLVDDVVPYELMKLRLLNASHQVLSYLGILVGATYVHEVCRDPLFVTFLLGYLHEEAIPTLRPVPGVDLPTYVDQLLARFGSTAVEDTLARNAVDGSDRIPKFLLPVICEQRRHGGDARRSVLALAAWSRFLEGRTEAGEPTPVVDRRAEQLLAAVAAEQREPGAFLELEAVFGDLGQDTVLREQFVAAREMLQHEGARSCLAALASSPGSRSEEVTR